MDIFKFHVSFESDNINSGDDALDALHRMMAHPVRDLGFEYAFEGYGYLGTYGTPVHVCEVLVGAEDVDSARDAVVAHVFAVTEPGLVVEFAFA